MSDHDIQFSAESYTVNAQEKISTGDYENHQLSITVEGSIQGVENMAEERPYVRRQLLVHLRDLQKTVQTAAENRIATEGAEDWSDPLA